MSTLSLPQNEQWGPLLWTILHSFAERLGKQSHPSILEDQRREFLLFLHYVGETMPCKKCREHYATYRKSNPLDGLPKNKEFFPVVKKWLYDLHCEVNSSRGIQNTIQFDDLSTLYSSNQFLKSAEELWKYYSNAVQLKAISYEPYQRLRAHHKFLMKIL
jgi:hypothetical protein